MAPRLHPRSIVQAALVVFAVGYALSACGGRSRTILEVDDDDTSHAGASSAGAPPTSRAGAASGGAPISAAGAPSVGGAPTQMPSAGAANSSAGAGAMCPNVKCAALSCPAGSSPVTLPSSCCPVCQADCAKECPAIGCGPGSHSEMVAGACCPVCVADEPMLTCEDGMKDYTDLRDRLVYKYQYGCTLDSDCVVVAPANACENGCGYEAIWSGIADNFSSNLKSAADTDCANCLPGPTPPCVPPPTAHCFNGQCGFLID